MLLRDAQRLAALRDIGVFLDKNDATFEEFNGTASRRSLDDLTELLGRLAQEDEEHRIGAPGARALEIRLSNDLRRKGLRPIVDIQRLREDELPRLGRIPFPHRRTNSTRLVTDARTVAGLVRPHAKVFIEAGLKPDFIARLRADAKELKAAIVAKGAHRTGRVKTTRAIALAVKRARVQVRVADSFVRAAVEPDSPLIAEWRSLCRAFRRPTRRAAGKDGAE